MMNRITKIMPLILVVVVVLELSACSIPQPKPKAGIWYCEELKIKIDFGYMEANSAANCAQIYNSDGTWQNVLCYIDYGSGIWICSEDGTEDYLLGEFKYRRGIFTVTTREDKKTYVFERIDD